MIEQSNFAELLQLREQEAEGLVLLGCGGDLMEWVEGVSQLLQDENIALPGFDISRALKVTTSGGRIDLLLLFDGKTVDWGRLAIWRIRYGDCSWLSDYVVNYQSHHFGYEQELDYEPEGEIEE